MNERTRRIVESKEFSRLIMDLCESLSKERESREDMQDIFRDTSFVLENQISEAWNAILPPQVPRFMRWSPPRRKKLAARSKETIFMTRWKESLEIAAKIPFLTGDVAQSAWIMSVDWWLKPGSVEKILEGSYGRVQAPAPAMPKASSQSLKDRLTLD